MIDVDGTELRSRRGGFLRAFWAWFRRDFVLRRLALLVSALCMLFTVGYILVHMILLAPVLLLAGLCFLYGVSGRTRIRTRP